jgi:predicted cupin superfamily sugar epimerase
MSEADKIIAKLGLQPLPNEGGFFARTWTGLAADSAGRPSGTAIYFLLTQKSFSAFHRLEADEVWHFYAGAKVEHWQLSPLAGTARCAVLGPDVLSGQIPQLVVPAGCWQGARIVPADESAGEHNSWSLVGCTLAPGWTDQGFTLGDQATLSRQFPAELKIISALTRI